MGKSAARVTKPEVIPPLRDGDRLTTREFMRRYEATPEGFRAELLNGVVYVSRWVETDPDGRVRVMPPISGGGHGRPQFHVAMLLGTYALSTPYVDALAPTTVILSDRTAVCEPDALLYILPEAGGAAGLGPDDYLHGPPELVVEVARTSADRDLGLKRQLYERHRVAEYVVWRTREQLIDWFRLNRSGRYVPLSPDDDGIIRSRAFPGLWLDPAALFAGNLSPGMAVVQQGIASPEHAAFVEKLRRAAARRRR